LLDWLSEPGTQKELFIMNDPSKYYDEEDMDWDAPLHYKDDDIDYDRFQSHFDDDPNPYDGTYSEE
jgi:hypothetical protein